MTGSTYDNKETLKTGWIHLSNNIDLTVENYEWTMSRFGRGNSYYEVWFITPYGYLSWTTMNYTFGARPTFYLTSDITLKSGTGVIENPYILNF